MTSALICEYGVLKLEVYDWEENEVISKEEGWGNLHIVSIYLQVVVLDWWRKRCLEFWRYTVKNESGNGVDLRKLWYSYGSGAGRDEKREVPFVQHMKVTAPLGAMEQNLGSNCVRLFTPDEMHHSACCEELKHGVWRLANGMDLNGYRQNWKSASCEIKFFCASPYYRTAMVLQSALCESILRWLPSS